jgi:hypothetical protein
MVNQICIAGLVQGLSEGLHFAEKAGLDGRAVVEVISQGRGGIVADGQPLRDHARRPFRHGFAVDWMRKDLGICLATADETGASLPVTALVDQFYKDVQKMGGGRWDTSSLIKREVTNGCAELPQERRHDEEAQAPRDHAGHHEDPDVEPGGARQDRDDLVGEGRDAGDQDRPGAPGVVVRGEVAEIGVLAVELEHGAADAFEQPPADP